MSFISELSESRLFPSTASLDRYEAKELAELISLYLCALRILLDEKSKWARGYARKTVSWGKFEKWHSSATDLYVLLYGLTVKSERESTRYPLSMSAVYAWLRDGANDAEHEAMTRRLFTKLDFDLRIQNALIRSTRRQAGNWPNLGDEEKSMTLARLIQLLQHREPRSEIVPPLKNLMRSYDTEETVEDAAEPEAPKKRALFDFLNISEQASAGSTSSASVAAVPGALGAGFDPNGHERSIYPAPKKQKKDNKPIIIKRIG